MAPRVGRHGQHSVPQVPDQSGPQSWSVEREASYHAPRNDYQQYSSAPGDSFSRNGYNQYVQSPVAPEDAARPDAHGGYGAVTASADAYAAMADLQARSGRARERRPAPADPGSGGAGPRSILPGGPDALRGRHATEWGQNFGGVVQWTLLGSLIPGTGLITAGRRRTGYAVLAFSLLILLPTAVVLLTNPIGFVGGVLLSHPERLTYAAGAVVLVGLAWAAHVVATNLSLRRFSELTGVQNALSWVLVTTVAMTGVGVAAFSGKQLLLTRDTVGAIFAGDRAGLSGKGSSARLGPDPWADKPRVNVLLIGSDAGADRTGVRTDSLILASINTKTGDTVLLSLPRNLEKVPFPPNTRQAADFPEGFSCPKHECMINALWQFGVDHKDTYYKGVANPGLTATVQGVEQALGMTVDEYAMLNLRGFMSFVDALGGVTINVPRRIPVGGHRGADGIERGVTSYIEPGRQKLNGYKALWFARSRSDSDDFVRMGRQRCVIGAVSQQADPQTVAMHLPAIMKAAQNNIRSSIGSGQIDAWIALTLRVKSSHIRSLTVTDKVTAPDDPDFALIHELAQKALTPPAPKAKPAATPSPTTGATPSKRATTAKPTPSPSATHAPDEAVDVREVC